MNNLTASLLVLASAALLIAHVHPTYQGRTEGAPLAKRSIVELREERSRYEEALTKSREIETARTGLLEKFNRIAPEDRERLARLLPDHVDSVRLIIDINTVASQYGLTLRNITLADLAEKAGSAGALGPSGELYAPAALTFSLRGPYDSFRSFLRDLEQNLRLMDVAKLAFAAKDERAYDYEVMVTTYRLK